MFVRWASRTAIIVAAVGCLSPLFDGVAMFMFLYPTVLLDQTVQKFQGSHAARHGNAPFFNHINHVPDLVRVGDTSVVTPNIDTLYSSAILDLDTSPVMVLSLPSTASRFVVFQAMDMVRRFLLSCLVGARQLA